MKCLFDRLSTCEQSDVLWIAEPIGQVDITRLIQAFGSVDHQPWKGKRVAIGALPVIEFACALAFLDGLAQTIVLLPTEDDPPTLDIRLAQAEIDIVLEGNGFGFANMLASFDSIASKGTIQPAAANRTPAIQTNWLLPTSGTTGTPKLIAHTFDSLTRSMTCRRIGDDYTWGCLYSLRRFAGLQVFLQSWMCSTPLILNEEYADFNDVIARFIRFECNALSATPSMWRIMSMHPLFDRMALNQITMGGEIVDQAVLDMLAKRFPAARITHIYASTEAGVGFAVSDGRAGFPTHYLVHPPLGVAMRIDDQKHLRFAIKLEQSLQVGTENEWIDSGDVVDIQGDRVRFLGRANGSINVGGNKVMPEEIESVINELPEVAFVQVRARTSAMLGSLVEAAITLTPGKVLDTAFKKRVMAHCSARLDNFKVPAFIVAADAIQLTASGKISRRNKE
jgi:acyl-CoA synthetase (AMP-forming)/AMP-acid ligase II